MTIYQVEYDQTDSGTWGAYIPGLPGCVAVADTFEEVQSLIAEAAVLHVGEDVALQHTFVSGPVAGFTCAAASASASFSFPHSASPSAVVTASRDREAALA